MLTRYWSVSQQVQLQPQSKSKAWQLGTQLQNGQSASACYCGWIGVILLLLQYLIVTTKIGWKGLITQWLMCWTLHLEFWFQDLAWSFSCVVWQETFLLNASLHQEV